MMIRKQDKKSTVHWRGSAVAGRMFDTLFNQLQRAQPDARCRLRAGKAIMRKAGPRAAACPVQGFRAPRPVRFGFSRTLLQVLPIGVFFLLTALIGLPGANAQVMETFDTPGMTTWTVPTGVTSITVEAWGGGGAGGGSTNAGSLTGRGGAGGGGGAFASSTLTVTPESVLTIVVAGTASGVSGATGDSGDPSFVGPDTNSINASVRAAGGSGGSGNTGGGSPAGGAGGTVAASVGTTLEAGADGGNGATGLGISSGAGGAGAQGGAGGAAIGSGTSNGNPGTAPGGGGGGARTSQNGGNRTGGAGAQGQVRITYSAAPPEPPPGQVCAVPSKDGGDVSASGVLNSYFPPDVGTYGPSSWTIGLGAGRGAAEVFEPGDLALVIQMQCADITTTNDDNYGGNDGTGRGYADPVGTCLAGQYEYVRAGAATTSTSLDLSETPLQGDYIQDAGTSENRRTFQVIRVPQYGALTLSGTVTAEYWDGTTGGVVALDVVDGLTWGGQTIDVAGRGFRGAGAWQWGGTEDTNNPPDYRRVFDDSNPLRHSHKGEGIVGTPRVLRNQPDNTRVDLTTSWGGYVNGDTGRGAPGNAGGGGNNRNGTRDNGGGGGGGNGGIGGYGGYGWKSGGWSGVFGSGDFDLRGIGGAAFASPAPNRVVMGGGGGAGGTNNDGNTNPRAKGGTGGGIVIVRAGSMTGTGTVDARGADGETMPINDAGGGGGAGGSVVLMSYNSDLGTVTVDVRGGQGGDSALTGSNPAHGGGGGGAGGVVIRSGTATVSRTGGANGITSLTDDPVGGENHGATAGEDGIDTVSSDSSFRVWPGALCPPTAVVMGNVELAVVSVADYLQGIGAKDGDREGLLAILRAWDPDAAAGLQGAGREAILAGLADYLDPDGDGQVVVFRWETVEERGTIGFYAERKQDGVWVRINHEMLPGLIASPMGAQYWLADPGARPGDNYQYRLIEVEARGTTREYGPFDLGP